VDGGAIGMGLRNIAKDGYGNREKQISYK